MPAKGAMAPAEISNGILIDGVSRRFGARTVLSEVSLRVEPNEVVAIVGPSGAGKSTLLELICGLQRADSGTISAGRAVLMPQHDALFPWLDAADNAGLPLRLAGSTRRDARAVSITLLADLGLAEYADAAPAELSGGMRQRVAVARTLLSGAATLCLDEPFGALDAITRAGIQRWLAGVLTQTPRTVVLVTHDVEEAALLGDRVLVLSPQPGRIVAEFNVAAPRRSEGRTPTDPGVVTTRAAAFDALTASVSV